MSRLKILFHGLLVAVLFSGAVWYHFSTQDSLTKLENQLISLSRPSLQTESEGAMVPSDAQSSGAQTQVTNSYPTYVTNDAKTTSLTESSVTSVHIARHAIESENLDSNAVNSRIIEDGSVSGEDVSEDADLKIASLEVEGAIESETLDINGATSIGGLLTVSGAAAIGGALSVGDTVTTRSNLGLSYAGEDLITRTTSIAAWGDSLTSGAGGDGTSYPSVLATLSGYTVYNGGVGGETSTQIKTRMLAATDMHDRATIIWAGRNNASSPAQVKADIAEMVAALGHDNYLVLSVLNGSGENEGSAQHTYITELNNDLANIYGDHYVDIRSYLVSQYDSGIPQDVTDYNNDVTPTSLRFDALHLNAAGYTVVANYVYSRFAALQPAQAVLTTESLANFHLPSLGIGTDDPAQLLEVAGGQNSTTAIQLSNTSSNTSTPELSIFFRHAKGFANGGVGVGGKIVSGRDGVYGGSTLNHGSNLQFYVASGGNDLEAIRITSSRNVGIGITAPAARLDIVGTNTNALNTLLKVTNQFASSAGTTRLLLDSRGNLGLNMGATALNTTGAGVLAIGGSTAPSGALANAAQLFAVDQAGSHELRVMDEAGNTTTLSPHNFSLISEGPSESLAWSFYSERGDESINVDMLKSLRIIESLSGEPLVYYQKNGEIKTVKSSTGIVGALDNVDEDIADIQDSIIESQEEISTLQNEISALLDFYSTFELGSFIAADEDGSVTLTGTLKTPALETSSVTVVNTDEEAPTIGQATLEAGETEVEVETKALTEESRIFVTIEDESDSEEFTEYKVRSRKIGESFVIVTPEAIQEDLVFSWWIVEEK